MTVKKKRQKIRHGKNKTQLDFLKKTLYTTNTLVVPLSLTAWIDDNKNIPLKLYC